MSIESIRLVESDKDVLVRLKRTTGIKNWNTLARWAFCLSLADPSPTSVDPRGSFSGVEMTWKTFGGAHSDAYWAALIQRMENDGLPNDPETRERYFHRHLHRGIGLLANLSVKTSIRNMLELTITRR